MKKHTPNPLMPVQLILFGLGAGASDEGPVCFTGHGIREETLNPAADLEIHF